MGREYLRSRKYVLRYVAVAYNVNGLVKVDGDTKCVGIYLYVSEPVKIVEVISKIIGLSN